MRQLFLGLLVAANSLNFFGFCLQMDPKAEIAQEIDAPLLALNRSSTAFLVNEILNQKEADDKKFGELSSAVMDPVENGINKGKEGKMTLDELVKKIGDELKKEGNADEKQLTDDIKQTMEQVGLAGGRKEGTNCSGVATDDQTKMMIFLMFYYKQVEQKLLEMAKKTVGDEQERIKKMANWLNEKVVVAIDTLVVNRMDELRKVEMAKHPPPEGSTSTAANTASLTKMFACHDAIRKEMDKNKDVAQQN